MKSLARFFTVAILTACPAAPLSAHPPQSCVPADSCGCRIVITGAACPDGGAHFFHELADGAPLQFKVGQNTITATSARPRAGSFSPAAGDSWTETYHHNDGGIEIRYTPGTSTCSKLAQNEACEFLDVHVQVSISGPQGARSYSGTGRCGC